MPKDIPAPDPTLDKTRSASSASSASEIDSIYQQFIQVWRSGQKPRIEDYLESASAAERNLLLRKLLSIELSLRKQSGESLAIERYLSRFPEDCETVAQAFSQTDHLVNADSTFDLARTFDVETHSLTTRQSPLEHQPLSIARYRKVRKLGEGAFGAVWLVEDLELKRQVALKEPRPDRLKNAADIETYLAEARVLASLDHPHIVPVYDVGRTEEGSCYVVSKLIDGTDLAEHVKQKSITFAQSAILVAQIADALQHTHNRGLVHRDIKPANILIDGQQRPYVTDFGLALRDEDFGRQEGIAGTPAYMSPEQARGESHLVDGRSDIFSLGVVLYELLSGTRPFRGDNWPEVLQRITTVEAKPLRQLNEAIPKELERICLKALSKRAADRYPCATDLAEDLRKWASPSAADQPSLAPVKIVPKGLRSFDAADSDFFLELLPGPRDRDGLPETLRFWKTRIEETDPERTFRVGLVYGPSGCGKSSLMKAGLLPRLSDHVIHVFLEATPDQTESQLRQGLRRACPDSPRNSSLVDTLSAIRRGKGIPTGRKVVLVIDQFEQWLYSHGAEPNSTLAAALRQCDGGRIQAVLLVRDDFWMPISEFLKSLDVRLIEGDNANAVSLFDPLHARKVLSEFGKAYGRLPENLGQLTRDQDSFLSQSITGLSQDGKVISVRLALFSDMMKSRPWTPAVLAEVGGTAGVGATFLEETFSSRTAPPQHRQHQEAARAVLRALLPTTGTDIKGHMRSASELQEISGYANRPDAFAELISILDSEVRLITPVGSENLDAGIEKAAEPSATISAPTTHHPSPTTHFYQLTHDYLVPSLRDWLTRKQRETRRGQAELKLEERSAVWNAKPENKQLPSLWEFANIRLLTDRRQWSDQQRNMMSRATRFHALRSTSATVAMIGLLAVGLTIRSNVARQQETTRIEGLVGRLLDADPNQLPEIATQLSENPEVSHTMLAPLLASPADTANDQRTQLHARLASVHRDPSLVKPLMKELLTGKATYVGPIRELLKPYASQLSEEFWNLLRDEAADAQLRFRAALALADHAPQTESASWTEPLTAFVAEQLVSANAEFQPTLRNLLRPIQARLLPDLERIFENVQATDAQRLSAANAFADYAASNIGKLSSLLAVATSEQYAVIYPLVAANPIPASIDDLGKIAGTLPPDDLGSVPRIPFGQRRANAAVTLLRLGEREKVLPVFDWSDDPEALTQFIFRCRPRGIGVESLLDLLELVAASADRYPKNTRYALMLAIGEYARSKIPQARRAALVEKLSDWYANDPSSGVHGAAGWLLRHLGQQEIVTRVDQTPVPYSPDREWFTLAITVTPRQPLKPEQQSPAKEQDKQANDDQQAERKKTETTDPVTRDKSDNSPEDKPEAIASDIPPLPTKTFYYTFIVFSKGDYKIGSPVDERERNRNAERELQHMVRLTRPFALLDREVTMEELIAFKPSYMDNMQQYQSQPVDAAWGVHWYDSVDFCCWLGAQMGLAEGDQAHASPESLDVEQYPREPSPLANWAPRDWPLDLDRRGFRLPTGAEWEVATRGGSRTAYGFGGEVAVLGRFGWFEENCGKHVHPTKELRPSVRGLFDLHGNQFEWTHDWYKGYSGEMEIDPITPPGGTERVVRGGAWGNGAAMCRASNKNFFNPTSRPMVGGFRPALSPSSQAQVPAERGLGAESAGVGTKRASAEQRPEMP